jgi:hypothetical protein
MKGHMGTIHFTLLPQVQMHLHCSDPVHFTGPPKSLIPQQFYHELPRTPSVIDALSLPFICRHTLMCKRSAKSYAQLGGTLVSRAVAYESTKGPRY